MFRRGLLELIASHQESKQSRIEGTTQHAVLLWDGNVTKPR